MHNLAAHRQTYVGGLESLIPSNKVLKSAATEWPGAKIISDRK